MLPKKNIVLVAAFGIPMLCCLIGAGAFVLLVTPVAEHGDPNTPDPIEALQANLEDLKAKLAKLNQRIKGLHDQVQKEQQRVELAQRINDLMDHLESSTTGLLRELSAIAEELSVIQAGFRSLVSSGSQVERSRDADKGLRSLQDRKFGCDMKDSCRIPITRFLYLS